ncbi:putative ABC transporter family, HlyB subfamily protease secretion (ATP-binding protein) [Bosea sp. LC85]|uniref:type I secretion system permease/ATPase n=1 Tax=Bosea sp. LC85 TaxID=1502851 RepID=UPI0004E2E40D|nr:type I secretion system permease/ATPase [Bosea sp. LC85]KFC64609.1 putative ABC transporter family, HlyB subfamily protease secretion (ATP-binding protein) [Bosea sp. LC85]
MTVSSSGLDRAMKALVPAFLAIFVVSFFYNLLALGSLFYMRNLFDRVIPTRSMPTLYSLLGLIITAWVFYAVLEWLRAKAMNRVAVAFDRSLAQAVFDAVHRTLFQGRSGDDGMSATQTLRDVDTLRDRISGGVLATAADALWSPLFIAAAFAINIYAGIAMLVGVGILLLMGIAVTYYTSVPMLYSLVHSLRASEFADRMLQNSEVIRALGMRRTLQRRWLSIKNLNLSWQEEAASKGQFIESIITFVRMSLSSLIMALAAVLVIEHQISGGNMMMLLIISTRAISPVATMISTWKNYLSMKMAYQRLQLLFSHDEIEPRHMPLHPPVGRVCVQGVSAVAPGRKNIVLRDISFDLEPGEVLGVIGPTGSGKSSLARVLVGVWPATIGAVRLDGANIKWWDSDELGKHLGYIPQDVELFPGTVAQNIARFTDCPSSEIIKAAMLAGVHDLILSLPDGYETQIGERGAILSGGQRQRIALARAVLGSPALIVMDEPNANLDTTGEECLVRTIKDLAELGSTVIVITHRGSLLSQVDKVLLLVGGAMHGFGGRNEVMQQISRPRIVELPPRRSIT